MLCFSRSDPEGVGQANVGELLRGVADTIDSLAETEVSTAPFFEPDRR
jgi:hypothetical protein